jgi:hypothetical protein
MKLTKADKEYLKNIGYIDVGDFEQIEKASGKTTYTLCDGFSGEETLINTDKAIELLGRETYLSGISRSAFHWSAVRDTKQYGVSVYFDSSKFFR